MMKKKFYDQDPSDVVREMCKLYNNSFRCVLRVNSQTGEYSINIVTTGTYWEEEDENGWHTVAELDQNLMGNSDWGDRDIFLEEECEKIYRKSLEIEVEKNGKNDDESIEKGYSLHYWDEAKEQLRQEGSIPSDEEAFMETYAESTIEDRDGIYSAIADEMSQ